MRYKAGLETREKILTATRRLIADAGLIGLPNAGKSTFLRAVSAATPKVADYPFTTLHPHLGVASLDSERYVVADIPGLIEGAAEGAGLGVRFLGHIERCAALIHLVDGTQDDVAGAYRIVRRELSAYGEGLVDKPEIVAINKIDAIDSETLKKRKAALRHACSGPVLAVSGVSRAGVRELLGALSGIVRMQKDRALAEARSGEDWTP